MPFCSVSKACRLIDILCICLLITPLAVLYWAGTWRIFDLYIFPQRTRLSATVSLAAGTTGGIVGYFLLPLLRTRIHPSCNFNHAIVSRMFCYAYGLCFLNTWRGLWMWTDELLGTGLVSSWVRLIIAESLLILCGCSTNTVSIPFTITLDTRPSFYLTFPCFRTQPEEWFYYLLDCFFTVVIVQGLVIQVWSGLWNIMNYYIYPDDRLLSYGVSAGVGLLSTCIILLIQYHVFLLSKIIRTRSENRFFSLLLEISFKIVATLVCLLLWRGSWGWLKDYVLPQDISIAYLSHVTGFTGLLLMQVISLVSPTGCERDSDNKHAHLYEQVLPVAYTLVWWKNREATHQLFIQSVDENSPLLTTLPRASFSDIMAR